MAAIFSLFFYFVNLRFNFQATSTHFISNHMFLRSEKSILITELQLSLFAEIIVIFVQKMSFPTLLLCFMFHFYFNPCICNYINLYMEDQIDSACTFHCIVSSIHIWSVLCSFQQLVEVTSKMSAMCCLASSIPTHQDYQFPCDIMLLDSKCNQPDMLHALYV